MANLTREQLLEMIRQRSLQQGTPQALAGQRSGGFGVFDKIPTVQQERPKTNLLIRSLPVLGAIGGSFIPGAGTIAGGAAGAALGEALRQRFSGEKFNLGKVATEGAFGLAGGVAGKVAAPALRGVGGFLGVGFGKSGAKAVPKIAGKVSTETFDGGLAGAGRSLQKGLIRPIVKPSATSAQKENELVAAARNMLGVSSAEGKRFQSAKLYSQIQAEINRKLPKIKETVALKDVLENITKNLDEVVNKDAGFDRLRKEVISKITASAKDKNLSATALFGLKNNFATRLGRVFGKIENNVPLTGQEEAVWAAWEALDDIVINKFKGIKNLTLQQSYLHRLAPGLKKSAQEGLSFSPLGIPVGKALTRPVQTAMDAAGRTMENIGRGTAQKGAKASSSLLSPERLGVTLGASVGQQPPEEPQNLGQAQEQTQIQERPILSPQGQWRWDEASQDWVPNDQPAATDNGLPSPEALQEAYITAFKQGDMKAADQIKEAFDFLYPDGVPTGGEAPLQLSDSAIKNVTDLKGALTDVEGLARAISENSGSVGPVAGLQALNPYSSSRQIQAQIDRVRQVVGKALEGGVLRKEDEEKYKKILPTIRDTQETAQAKLQQLYTKISQDLETYVELQRAYGKGADQPVSGVSLQNPF